MSDERTLVVVEHEVEMLTVRVDGYHKRLGQREKSAESQGKRIGEIEKEELKMFLEDYVVYPPSLAGVPSLAIPCGFWRHLPMGMQLIGPMFKEKLLFQIAYQYQKITNWHKQLPPLLSKKEDKE